MTHLDIRVLGVPEIQHGSDLLRFPTRKALALLVFLAVEGESQPRDKLVALFWPESSEQQGRASLRNTLSYVNNTLRVVDKESHLIVDRDSVALDFNSDVSVDARDLITVPDTAYSELVTAYRGDFLEGFSLSDAPSFDDWASTQRERLHSRMSNICEHLTRLHYERGEMEQAITIARRWVSLDKLNEFAHQWLIRSLFAAGQRAAALQAYNALVHILSRELEVPPLPETQVLAERLKMEVLELPKRVRDDLLPSAMLDEMPFVGRGTEFSALVAEFHRVSQGRAGAVVLIGEAGIGKTRLASEFLLWTEAEGAKVARGRAFESSGQLPYQIMVEVLRDLRRTDEVGRPALVGLAPLLPELRGAGQPLMQADDEATARTELFEAAAGYVASQAGARSLVILLDDLQWADAASLDLLQFAARRWQEQTIPLLLVMTVRSEVIMDDPSFAEWLVRLSRELPLRRIALSPLSQNDTLQLVRALGVERPTEFGEWLFSGAEGHPFYTAETLKDLLERGKLTARRDADGKWRLDTSGVQSEAHHVPHAVRELIRTRLARLSPDAATMLAAGAVLGASFSFELLCLVSAMLESSGLVALDELLAGRFLIERGRSVEYQFAHDKIRDAVYEAASLARRRVFHRRALEGLSPIAPPATLAYHALAAGLVEQAMQFHVAAGDAAMQLFAITDAIRHYEQARELSGGRTLAGGALLRLGHAYELNAEAEKARVLYEGLLDQQALSLSERAEVLNHLAVLAAQRFDLAGAIGLLQGALVAAHGAGEMGVRAETQWNLAQINYYAAEFDAAYIYGEGALR
jgi:DNA-binding SARP family transcriptional activator